ncbi:hypothetical protein FH966_02515 [Lentibacillus cibarius]|uniref:Helix-turn-helix domain-containing protein n=1 Tax=Lentibacillus cibarius TaxID=2583219 RepID=A0A549YFL1_9BACI|nr:hypothetical protein [Lentibacillus cibarius]TRM10680.1 hypothetical protein FH966_02515 [Lentibacillus cibarius]
MARNQDIRRALKNQAVHTWELAERLGVHETTLYRYLRKDLPRQQKQEYLQMINEIANSKSEDN